MEVRTGFFIHSKHHLGHAEVIAGMDVGRVCVDNFLEGGNTAIEVAFKALDESDLPLSVGVVWFLSQNAFEHHFGVSVFPVTAGLKSGFVEFGNAHVFSSL